MSFVTEPQTTGKVILKTTVGLLDIELWAKECPLACRNFVQLCLEGYYDNLIFHRIVKDFLVQTGDPTGTGDGGTDSIYGGHFKDEVNQRLRFSHRGIVACASFGKNQNGSQFFITLAPTPNLDRKHTVFGKVTGESIYNLNSLGNYQVDANDRPEGKPPRILSVEVVLNPFDDIVPREKVVEEVVEEVKVQKPKEKKNFSLISFGDEAEEEEEELASLPQFKMSSLTGGIASVAAPASTKPTNTEFKKRKVATTKPLASESATPKSSFPKVEYQSKSERELEKLEKAKKEANELLQSLKGKKKVEKKVSEKRSRKEAERATGKKFLEEQQSKYKKRKVADKKKKASSSTNFFASFGSAAPTLKSSSLSAHTLAFEEEEKIIDLNSMARDMEKDDYEVVDTRESNGKRGGPRRNDHQKKLHARKRLEQW
eukprot:TRINITY_DN13001_c0_g1_i1.p1 TRINITY_DN13001_c0_g1~~TRINITY_DN13001_c0_g1_i1.p1  ORF type:complete len:453 (-),score=145.01 TRINITY_DN13001_c0_g1_i1:5-1291(-)